MDLVKMEKMMDDLKREHDKEESDLKVKLIKEEK